MTTHVQLVDGNEALRACADEWNRLNGNSVFRSFDWLSTWWKHYGDVASNRCLHTLVVYDYTKVIGIAPWFAERSLSRGSVVRWLGSGEVCSDHLSLLCDEKHEQHVAHALAEHLVETHDWDRLELGDVDHGDTVVEKLIAELASRGIETSQREAGNCWAIEMPENWEGFLAQQSKSHRKQLRRAHDRVLATDRAQWHLATAETFEHAWATLVDLHQRRRISLGEPGCFASTRFTNFHYEVAQKLLAAGKLRLSWLELDGKPAAAEYHFATGDTTFAYQGGVDPDRLDDEPGRLSNIATIMHALQEGHATFDFLRGDEPYKAHWRAKPRPTIHYRAIAPRSTSKLRAQTTDLIGNVAGALKSSFAPLVTRAAGGEQTP